MGKLGGMLSNCKQTGVELAKLLVQIYQRVQQEAWMASIKTRKGEHVVHQYTMRNRGPTRYFVNLVFYQYCAALSDHDMV